MTSAPRDHGGGLDAAIARWGGARQDWIDLSTGINPRPYPVRHIPAEAWTALPDTGALDALTRAARTFWQVPSEAAVLAAPGASALIARIPHLAPPGRVHIPEPTYNEHAAAFRAAGWQVTSEAPTGPPDACVLVHPNNPDGRWSAPGAGREAGLLVIDESFADTDPARSRIAETGAPGTLVLKSFGKFWGLAGLRLGFAIGDPALVGRLSEALGPWPVSGPALAIATAALRDTGWAETTRARLSEDAGQLDAMLQAAGARPLGGTPLFRLFETENAAGWQARLAGARIWSRIFPYSRTWLRLGLPGDAAARNRLAAALALRG